MDDLSKLIKERLDAVDKQRENAKKAKKYCYVGRVAPGIVASPFSLAVKMVYEGDPLPEGTAFWVYESRYTLEMLFLAMTRRVGLGHKWLTIEELVERYGEDVARFKAFRYYGGEE